MKKNILASCIFAVFLLLNILTPAFAVTNNSTQVNNTKHTISNTMHPSNKNMCPCIIFRLDDIQAYYLHKVQMKIIDTFQKKSAGLTIGIIGYDFVKDKTLVSYIKQKVTNGSAPIDIANHGWKHENFANLNKTQQIYLLNKTNQELQKVFGKKPPVFITPFNLFNNYTLSALRQLKMQVISSSVFEDDNPYVTAKGKIILNKDLQGLYHVPAMTDFQTNVGMEQRWTKVPEDKLIANINSHIKAIGYDVILLHPQNFAIFQNNTYIDTLDNSELAKITSIIDYAKAHHIKIITISGLVGIKEKNISTKAKSSAVNSTKTTALTKSNPLVSVIMGKLSHLRKTIQSDPSGSVTLSMRYPNGDRVSPSSISLKIYQDVNGTVYREIPSITGDPYDITNLPLDHQYKIEVYQSKMLESTDYANLDSPKQELDVGIPDEGSLKVTAYYNDGQTPIADTYVIIKSQDNKTIDTGFTDPDGITTRFWLPPTNIDGNYYNIDFKVSDKILYSYLHVYLLAGQSEELKVVTPWPYLVSGMNVKVFDQSRLLTGNRMCVVDILDDKGHKISESNLIHGEAYFSNLKIGSYVIKAVNLTNGSELGTLKVIIDGTKTNFNLMIDQPNLLQ